MPRNVISQFAKRPRYYIAQLPKFTIPALSACPNPKILKNTKMTLQTDREGTTTPATPAAETAAEAMLTQVSLQLSNAHVEIATLRAALAPFAARATDYAGAQDYGATIGARLVHDCRRAKEVLDGAPAPP